MLLRPRPRAKPKPKPKPKRSSALRQTTNPPKPTTRLLALETTTEIAPATSSNFNPVAMGSTTSSVTLKEFTWFLKLPFDIRTDIWRLTLPGARIVKVVFDGSYRSTAKIPIALHVCRESRREFMRFYQLSFGNKHGKEADVRGTIWFNPSIDIFCIDQSVVGHHEVEDLDTYWAFCLDQIIRRTSNLATIQHLAVDMHLLEAYRLEILYSRTFGCPNQFLGLKNAYLFSLRDQTCDHTQCREFDCEYQVSAKLDVEGWIVAWDGGVLASIENRLNRAKKTLDLHWTFATYIAPGTSV